MAQRVILHSDLNACYASIEELHHPELRGRPLAVGGDAEQRHGIILAKNQAAKTCGIKTGETIWQARQKCPGLEVLPPNFDLYWQFCKRVRGIYSEYTDRWSPLALTRLDLICPAAAPSLAAGREWPWCSGSGSGRDWD